MWSFENAWERIGSNVCMFLNTAQLGSLSKSGKGRFPGVFENGKCPCAEVEFRHEIRNKAWPHETVQRVSW